MGKKYFFRVACSKRKNNDDHGEQKSEETGTLEWMDKEAKKWNSTFLI